MCPWDCRPPYLRFNTLTQALDILTAPSDPGAARIQVRGMMDVRPDTLCLTNLRIHFEGFFVIKAVVNS